MRNVWHRLQRSLGDDMKWQWQMWYRQGVVNQGSVVEGGSVKRRCAWKDVKQWYTDKSIFRSQILHLHDFVDRLWRFCGLESIRALEGMLLLYLLGLVCLDQEMKAGSTKPDIEKHRFYFLVAFFWFFCHFHCRRLSYRFAVNSGTRSPT